MTYHYTSDNDIPAFNVVGTLLFPHTAMYYYTREGAPPCLVVTSAVMHVTLTKAPPPQQYLSDSIVPESLPAFFSLFCKCRPNFIEIKMEI